MDASEGTELVVALHEQRMVGAVEWQAGGSRLDDQLVRILRKERGLRQSRAVGIAVNASRLTPRSASCERTRYAAPTSSWTLT